MQITPLGDCAALVRVAENFETAPDDALQQVMTAQRCLASAKIPGVVELAPAYATVALFYDPLQVVAAGAQADNLFTWLEQRISEALARPAIGTESVETSAIEIPVCYDGEFGFDLDEVAQRAGLGRDEVIGLHSSAKYRVHCVGFIGGFPFLGGLPGNIATPRRESPRKEIPAGSVGIGGKQTGIYPIKSPGGWNIIGRTPLRLFDPQRSRPGLLRVGDRVRFRPVSREEFDQLTE